MTPRRNSHARRLGLLIALATPLLLLPSVAVAAKKQHKPAPSLEVQVCIDGYKKGAASVQSARLRAGKDFFAGCMKPACPAIMRQECTSRYMRLDADIPSVIPVATDEAGKPVVLVEVKMDGEVLTSKLDGKALLVDPGKHDFSFALDSGVFAKKSVMIVQGQHNRSISVVLHAKKAPPVVAAASEAAAPAGDTSGARPEGAGSETAAATEAGGAKAPEDKAQEGETAEAESTEREVPQAVDAEETRRPAAAAKVPARRPRTTRASPGFLTYATAGVGVAGITGYFLLNAWGRKDNDALGECAAAGNLCPVSSVKHIQNIYLAANISGAVGLAALATSAFLYYRSQTSEEEAPMRPPTATVKPPRRTAASISMLDIQATPSGALATVGGAF